MFKLKLRIKDVRNDPRYRYMISGLKVNGKRRRLFFTELRSAKKSWSVWRLKPDVKGSLV